MELAMCVLALLGLIGLGAAYVALYVARQYQKKQEERYGSGR